MALIIITLTMQGVHSHWDAIVGIGWLEVVFASFEEEFLSIRYGNNFV